jgi:hypothetical protein
VTYDDWKATDPRDSEPEGDGAPICERCGGPCGDTCPAYACPLTGRIIEGLSARDYHAHAFSSVPHLSASIAKILIDKTPEHARLVHPLLRRPDDPAPAKETIDDGTLIHHAVLERFDRIAIIEAKDYRTKAAQEARDAALADGKIPLVEGRVEEITRAAHTIRRRIAEAGTPLDGTSELTVTWTELATDGAPVQCKARIDHLRTNALYLTGIDLKTCGSADDDSIGSQMARLGYDVQEAAYRRAIEALRLSSANSLRVVEFLFAFAELEPPHAVRIVETDSQFRALGARMWRYAIDTWAECLRTGVWPATYSTERLRVECKPWRLMAFETKSQGVIP